MKPPYPFAVLTVLLIAGCMLPFQRREDSITKAAREFNDGLRWGRDEKVAACLTALEARSLQARRADLGDDFVLADHEVTAIEIEPGAEKATVLAEFTWFNQRRALVKKSTIEQRWEWTAGRWMVASQRRIRGDRFPLVPELSSALERGRRAP